MTARRMTLAAMLVVAALTVVNPPSVSAKPISGACDQPVVTDTKGDGAIDIASVRLTSDCRIAQFTLTTHKPFADADLDAWVVLIGPTSSTVRDPICGNLPMAAAVFNEPGKGLTAALYPLDATCQISAGATPRRAVLERVNGRTLRITFKVFHAASDARTEGFRWFSFTRPAVGDRSDSASRFAIWAPPLPFVSELAATSSHDGRSIRLTWLAPATNNHVEVQYRRAGGRWESIDDIPPWTHHATIEGVSPGKYEVRVAAVGLTQRSRWYTKRVKVIGAPSAIETVTLTKSLNGYVVTFSRPDDTGGAPIYIYWAWLRSGNESTGCTVFAARGNRCELSVTNFPAVLTVMAVNTGQRDGVKRSIRFETAPT